MIRSISKSIMAKLTLQFFLVGFVPLIILAATTYYYSKHMLESQWFEHIASLNTTKKEQVVDFLKERMKNLILQSRSQNITAVLDKSYYHIANTLFKDYMKIFGYRDILLLDMEGNVRFSAALNQDKNAQTPAEQLDAPVLSSLAAHILETNEASMTDLVFYEPRKTYAIFMGAPILNTTGDPTSILIFEVAAAQIFSLMQESSNLGETGEAFLIGEDYLMRSASRFSGREVVLTKTFQNDLVDKALKEARSGTQRMTGQAGSPVLTAYAPLQLDQRLGSEFDWAIVTKISEAEAFAFLDNLRINYFWTLVLLIVLVSLFGFFQSKSIAKPLQKLSYQVLLMDEGDFTAQLSDTGKNRSDEIGILLQAYDRGSKRFRKQLKQIKESSDILLSSISQISATSSQLSSSASETSSSISEVTTTVEEVKQTSEVSKDKAENVSQSAERTARISRAGKESTENTMAGVNRIKKEMNYIAESTVKLSEQIQRIGEIINTVTDIADQSNILSVNAAIEAAKAGEHGKGFAIVAQEVKSLADQSKDATNQVRSILNDIQKATSAAVMATERGTKTVEEAVELSEQAGDAIVRLSSNVSESAEAALQITASTQQQLSGMDQLSQAMESINDATLQNLESVKQLEEAIKSLEEMGQTMKDFISAYKV